MASTFTAISEIGWEFGILSNGINTKKTSYLNMLRTLILSNNNNNEKLLRNKKKSCK